MVILPSKGVIVVATPRTGSRAIKNVLLNSSEPDVYASKERHPFPHEVWNVSARDRGNEPWEIWTLCREPLSQLKSWITHAQCWGDPTDFLKTYRSRYFMYEGGMNIYRQITTRFFIYERNGHQALIDALDLPNVPKLEVVGKTDSQEHSLTQYQERLARERFYNDFVLYQQLTEGV